MAVVNIQRRPVIHFRLTTFLIVTKFLSPIVVVKVLVISSSSVGVPIH